MPRLLPITLIALACIQIVSSVAGLIFHSPLSDKSVVGDAVREALFFNSAFGVPIASLVLAVVAVVAGAGMVRASK